MTFRSTEQIRIDACSSQLLAKIKRYFEQAGDLHRVRAMLRFPSKRLAAVEAIFGAPLDTLEGHERDLAEQVAVEHNAERVIYFSEAVIGSRLERLNCGPLLRTFNVAFADQLTRELEAVRDHLRPVWDLHGLGDLDAAAPIQHLLELRRRALEGAEMADSAAPHAMASTFRHVVDVS